MNGRGLRRVFRFAWCDRCGRYFQKAVVDLRLGRVCCWECGNPVRIVRARQLILSGVEELEYVEERKEVKGLRRKKSPVRSSVVIPMLPLFENVPGREDVQEGRQTVEMVQ